MGIPQVPLPWAYHKSRYHGHIYHSPVTIDIPQVPKHRHTTVPLSWAYHKSRYHGHIYHSPVTKGIPQSRYQGHITSPVTIGIYIISPETRAYHIEYRYSSYFFHMVFYRFNKTSTIIIIIEYEVYGLASSVIGECYFTAPSATRI